MGATTNVPYDRRVNEVTERATGSRPETPALPAPGGLATALDRVGDRWSLLLVEALLERPRRFGELQDDVGRIAPNILTDRLRRLERTGIVVATPYSRRPLRFEYALTADGRELAGALRLLADWGARSSESAEPLRHDLCGTPLEARWYCPTCGLPIADHEAAELPTI